MRQPGVCRRKFVALLLLVVLAAESVQCQSPSAALKRFLLANGETRRNAQQQISRPADTELFIPSYDQSHNQSSGAHSDQTSARQLKKRRKGGKGMNKGKRGKSKGKGAMRRGKAGKRGGNKKGELERNYEATICESLGLGSSSPAGKHPASVFSKGKGKGKNRNLQTCSPDVFELLSRHPDLSIFLQLLEATGLDGALSCSGPFTVLAPSNVAFQKNPDLLQSLFNPKNTGLVQDMLKYHFVPQYYLSRDFSAGPLASLLGPPIDVKLNSLMFNQAGVSDPDLVSCNAVVHVIDDPLIPRDSPILPEICEILDFRRPEQYPSAGRFNGIFDRSLLRIHDRSLQYVGERCDNDILDTIHQDPLLSTFSSLLEEADLEDIFLCAGPFSVLAPTNSAFVAMDADSLEQLRLPQNQELLQEVLLYHILPGYQPSSSFVRGPSETLLFDSFVDVKLEPLLFDDANVLSPNNLACNGVIHKIGTVLVPGNDIADDKDDDGPSCDALTFNDRRYLQDSDCKTNILETARDIPELSTVVTMIEAADLEYIFDCPGPFTALLPNNQAFDNLSETERTYLADPSNQEALQTLLLYHILPNRTMSMDFVPGEAATLSDEAVLVRLFPLRFDEARVVTPDIDACESLIDIIDKVLRPSSFPTVAPSPAPTIAPTPMDICDTYTFNRRTRFLQNGGRDCSTNIFDTASASQDLEVITQLIAFAGLEPIFDCAGPFTALLPTNAALEQLEVDRPDFLTSLAGDRGALRNFLLYHILPGAQQLAGFPEGPADTLLDGSLVDVSTDPLAFDETGVVRGDIQACNGYIHVIGGVLDPGATAAPVTMAPTLSPVSAQPTTTPVQRLRIRDFYISFVNANADRAPTEAEYIEMMSRTNKWFSDAFANFYANDPDTDFIRSESGVDETLYGADAGIPEERFNIYIGFNFTDLVYSIDSELPETEETFDLLEAQISREYILEVVRTYVGTPFERVNEVWFAAVEKDVP